MRPLVARVPEQSLELELTLLMSFSVYRSSSARACFQSGSDVIFATSTKLCGSAKSIICVCGSFYHLKNFFNYGRQWNVGGLEYVGCRWNNCPNTCVGRSNGARFCRDGFLWTSGTWIELSVSEVVPSSQERPKDSATGLLVNFDPTPQNWPTVT